MKITAFRKIGLIAGLIVIIVITGQNTYAAVAFPWEEPITKLSQNLTHQTSTSIALIGMFVAGGALVFGGDLSAFGKKVTWMCLAISLMLGGEAFVNMISGGAALPPPAAASLI